MYDEITINGVDYVKKKAVVDSWEALNTVTGYYVNGSSGVEDANTMKPLNFKDWLTERGVDTEDFADRCNKSDDPHIREARAESWLYNAFKWGGDERWPFLALDWKAAIRASDHEAVFGFSVKEIFNTDRMIIGKASYLATHLRAQLSEWMLEDEEMTDGQLLDTLLDTDACVLEVMLNGYAGSDH